MVERVINFSYRLIYKIIEKSYLYRVKLEVMGTQLSFNNTIITLDRKKSLDRNRLERDSLMLGLDLELDLN